MVHGGGHHHVHHAGGRAGNNFGGSASRDTNRSGVSHSYQAPTNVYTSTNVFVQQQQYPWWTNMTTSAPYYRYRWDSASSTQSRASSVGVDRCDACCNACCRNFWCCLLPCLCCCWTSSPREQPLSVIDERAVVAPQATSPNGEVPSCCSSTRLCPGLVVSLVVFIVLVSLSTFGEQNFTMNAGETRRIHMPFLSQYLSVTSTSGGPPPGIRVYRFPTPCPPLTGRPIILQDQLTINLEEDDYQYDYFFLNAGSVLQVQVTQNKGSSNIYLLKGKRELRRLEGEEENDDEAVGFGSHTILKRFVSSGWNPIRFSHLVRTEDVYILLYDNASAGPGALVVSYNISLTTYNLNDQAPMCDEDSVVSTCNIDHGWNACVLVQATVGNADSTNASDLVTVQVENHRKWILLLLLSAAPALVQLVCIAVSRAAFSLKVDKKYRSDIPPPTALVGNESSSYLYGAIDPSQAQSAYPSAPPGSEDEAILAEPVEASVVSVLDPLVPLVNPENVIPLAPPPFQKSS